MVVELPFYSLISSKECVRTNYNLAANMPSSANHIWATTRENVPSDKMFNIRETRVMFPKSYSFYLTGLFKVLYEIWHIYFMYPFNVIAMKNGAKVGHCISTCSYCSENTSFG